MTRVVVLTPDELRELVRAAVDEALRGPRPQRARRAPVAPTGAPPPASPANDVACWTAGWAEGLSLGLWLGRKEAA